MAGEVERWSRLQAELYALISRDSRSNRMLVEIAAPSRSDVVVDVGCGAGAAVRRAAARGAEAIGVDPSPAMVAIAQRRSKTDANARFVVGAADDLPLPDDSCSIVWTVASMHHWPDAASGLRHAHRVLRPDGRLFVAEHARRRDGGHGLSAHEADQTAELLRSLGMRDVAVENHRHRLTKLVVVRATKARSAA